MTTWATLSDGDRPYARPIIDILMIGVLWSVSSFGYYEIKDAAGLPNGYKDAPLLFSAYYLGFTVLAALLFQHRLRKWQPLAHGVLPILAVIGMMAVFTLVVLPALPEIDLSIAPLDPPEFVFANAVYYVPKSFEILFQQVLILTIVLLFSALGWQTPQIGVLTAILFGLFHLSLIFNDVTAFYVARFTIAAICFGAIVPSLMLATHNGATLSYGLHWGFYVADNIFTHLILSSSS
ncbi:hypothetical protein Q4555_04485 [Octadecabacter sp. 1_MG-2023]|uniref:hypothetical protein n=1 Tax=unclassified Octadecabacter TaxID=196158 RepID=UPI001C09BEF1|nr:MULTISPECIES: hypothetical protein [unclassified Octadecabacter]MBU2992639.1 hypothetical protein [Octadecabacter sp. B2R22]MDO6733910.1 hypothetical protein [Octadecabacter sp. 1_MG-2023]